MPVRIAVLWTRLSGYLNTCLQALTRQGQVELLVFQLGQADVPYDESMYGWMERLYSLPVQTRDQDRLLCDKLEEFRPDAAIIAGWSIPAFRKVARRLRRQGVLVIGCMDTQWRGTMRQLGGVMTRRWHVQSLFDALWVPGEASARLGRRLGYRGNRLLYGLYVCDHPLFSRVAAWRQMQTDAGQGWPQRFVYMGRLAPEKGIADLAHAYRRYRGGVQNPWELWCIGDGPLRRHLEDIAGVRLVGFQQPHEAIETLKQTSILVLPSHYDAWGLVVHEATAAAMPVLCSRQCGSSIELVQDGVNGYLFEAGDVQRLAELMVELSADLDRVKDFGLHSFALSQRYSPDAWASYLLRYVKHELT